MKCYCVAIVAVALTAGVCGLPATADEADFETLEHQGADAAVLKYRLLKPEFDRDADRRHPLLVFLHGAGERGSDNEAQLKWGAEMMRSAAKQHGAFVLVPQCPKGQKWAEVDWGKRTHKMPEGVSEPFGLTMQVIAKMQEELPIDPKRLYVMGLSMGGYGTWDAVQRYPDTFAAAVPICGGGDETAAERIKTPVWAFHGGADGVVPVERSRKMIEAIKKAGGKPKYTEYPGVGHNSWNAAFKDPELLKWLFSHHK